MFLLIAQLKDWAGNGEREETTCSKRWNRTRGCCSKDTASVHGVPTLTELPGRPNLKVFKLCLSKNVKWSF